MAIRPPSDIILDVARAADPTRNAVATERLARMSVPGGGTQFASAIDEVKTTASTTKAPEAGLANARQKLAELLDQSPVAQKAKLMSPSDKAMQQFEAQVLKTFVEQMLPEASENNFGQGTAGGVWRSMLADEIAKEIAAKGGLGIREKVMAALQDRGVLPQSGPAEAGTARLSDRLAATAGANARDARLPLSLEQRFLDTARPAQKSGLSAAFGRG